jgi:SAM-dependent methyltransferase
VSEDFKAFEIAGWDERAGTYGALMARATRPAIEPLLEAAGVTAGARVLDVGTGPGHLAAAAAARGARVTGADLSEGMLAIARRRYPELDFVQADAEDLPFADGAFDAVIAAFVVNHLPEPERAAAEWARVGGRVALAMWGPEEEVAHIGLPTAASAGLDPGFPPGPSAARFADRDELARLLRSAGLTHVTVDDLRFDLHVSTFDAIWDGILGGTVRVSARFVAATPDQRDQAREMLRRLTEPFRTADGYALPTLIRIATGHPPPKGDSPL